MICSCKYIKQFFKTFIIESVKKQPENWRTESFFKHLTSRRDDDLPLNHIVTAISWLQRGTATTGHTNIRDKINFIYNTLLTDESQKRLSWVRLTFPSLQVGAACRRSHSIWTVSSQRHTTAASLLMSVWDDIITPSFLIIIKTQRTVKPVKCPLTRTHNMKYVSTTRTSNTKV